MLQPDPDREGAAAILDHIKTTHMATAFAVREMQILVWPQASAFGTQVTVPSGSDRAP
ncbi:hypothetical protein [Sphingomonas natans]|uniref:hypothetical protein n=1 Tax=Sphingomonas natans TaxID=3063330 RepID=UPI0026E2DDA2|nr:hypothetical protein [Sphingomonas sp. BIUV-7]